MTQSNSSEESFGASDGEFHGDSNSELAEDDKTCDSASDVSSLSSTKSSGKSAVLDFTKLGLHGRSCETAILLQAYHRIAMEGSHSELILVKGESGIGKSALVEDMRRPVTSEEPFGRYIQGKFDQLRQMEPLSALVAAFSDLCDLILISDNLREFRIAIKNALGEDVCLLGNVIPNLVSITSDHSYDTSLSDEPEMPSSSVKLASVFRAFLRAVSSPASPILMHLDDIHWADVQSQDIIKSLVLDPDIKNVLIVCTYRNSENGEKVRQHICGNQDDLEGLCVTEIELGNLSQEAVMSMITDLLEVSNGDVQALCTFVRQKTASNPYFICQFLELLQSQRLLRYSSKLSAWQFDMMNIKNETESSENVVDIVFQRIAGLSPLVQGVMQLASCLGHKFDSVLLEAIVFSELDNAAEQSWLTRNPDLMSDYVSHASLDSTAIIRTVLSSAMRKGFIDTIGEVGWYKFTHDRIQSGFYVMIPAVERERLHFRIGMRLRQDIDAIEAVEASRLQSRIVDSVLFIAVDQLNRGAEHVGDASERIAIARLNLTAAEAAINILTFISASKFLRAGLMLLDQGKWETQHELTRNLSIKLAHSELCLGNFDESMTAADEVVRNAQGPSKEDLMKAYVIKIQCLGGKGKLNDAIDLGFYVLNLLGETFRVNRWKMYRSLSDRYRIQWMIQGKSDDELMNLPLMEDEEKLVAMRILAFIVSYSYFDPDPTNALVSSFRMVELSLKYGKSPSTPLCIVCFGIFTSLRGNCEKVYRYGNLALRMQELLLAKEFSVVTAVLVYCFARHWKHPLCDGLGPLLRSYNIAAEAGNVVTNMNDRGNDYASMALHCGNVALGIIEEEVRTLAHKIAVTSDSDVDEAIIRVPFWQAQLLPHLQATLNLIGESENAIILTGEVMDQDQLTKEAKATDNTLASNSILINRYYLATIFEEYEAAEACIPELIPIFGFASSRLHYNYWNLNFYRGLNCYGLFRITKEKKYLRQAHRITKQLSKSHNLGYLNCTPMFLLLSAESKALSEELEEAHKLYDRAILSAATVGCMHFGAIANEKCGAMFFSHNQPIMAEIYLRRAIDLMLEWGAHAKVEQIEEKYRSLLFGAPNEVTLQVGMPKLSRVSHFRPQEVLQDIHIEHSNSVTIPSAMLS